MHDKSRRWRASAKTEINTSGSFLLCKSSKNTGKNLSESTLSECWKLSRRLFKDLFKKNGWLSVRTVHFLHFDLPWSSSPSPSSIVVLWTNSPQSQWKSAAWQPLKETEQGWRNSKAPFPGNHHYLTCLVVSQKTPLTRLSLCNLMQSSPLVNNTVPDSICKKKN